MNRIKFCEVENEAEVLQILDLQARNHKSVVDEATRKSQGFVTVLHNPDLLQKMNQEAPSIIAKDGDKVVGYCLFMPKSYGKLIPELVPMSEMLDTLEHHGKPLKAFRWFIMGQICIDANYRGQGVFDGMYQKMGKITQKYYDFVITEVAQSNTRSMRAHKRVGFKTMHEFEDEINNEHWEVLYWDLKNPKSVSNF
jgi:ribosomal protein S18 acetylase RimI-like enzyme